MEPCSSLLRLQEPAICHYPEPDQSLLRHRGNTIVVFISLSWFSRLGDKNKLRISENKVLKVSEEDGQICSSACPRSSLPRKPLLRLNADVPVNDTLLTLTFLLTTHFSMNVAGLELAFLSLAADGTFSDQTGAFPRLLIEKRNSPLYVVSLYVAVLRNISRSATRTNCTRSIISTLLHILLIRDIQWSNMRWAWCPCACVVKVRNACILGGKRERWGHIGWLRYRPQDSVEEKECDTVNWTEMDLSSSG
jgi:hypothetical protein